MARYIDYAKIPMQKNDIGAKTIGEYFEKLLLTLWDEQEGFSGKRPFGNSGWEYDVYASLISAGVVDGSLDEEGYVADVTYSAANDIVSEMIKQIFARGINAPAADVAPKSEGAELDREFAELKQKYDLAVSEREANVKALIEKTTEVERLEFCNKTNISTIATLYRRLLTVKTEAIKKFAERVKEIKVKYALPLLGLQTKDEIERYVDDILMQMRDGIDALVKEMTEGKQ